MFYSVLTLFVLSFIGFYLGKRKSIKLSQNIKLASLPSYYGYLAMLYILIPTLIAWFVLLVGENFVLEKYLFLILKEFLISMSGSEVQLFFIKIKNLSEGASFGNETDLELLGAQKIIQFKNLFLLLTYLVIFLVTAIALYLVNKKISPTFKSQRHVEKIVNLFIQLCSYIAILITVGIFLSLVFETINFFGYVNPLDFLFGINWNPNKAFVIDSSDVIDKDILKDAFGIIPLMTGTLLVAFLAMLVSIPLGLMSAIYLAEYAPKRLFSRKEFTNI